MNIRQSTGIAALAAALSLAGCGGGGSGTTPDQATASGATGVMTRTAATTISVNGVAFSTAGAAVRIDDSPAGADRLQDGMVVKLRGADDGRSGSATQIEVENEVRGPVQSVSAGTDPRFFTVGGIRVVVDANTIYANLSPDDFSGVSASLFVEVHGLRDAAGNLIATRVEGKGPRNPAAAEVDELRGTVGDPAAGAFDLGPVRVSYTAATAFVPAGRCSAADMTTGRLVEVHGSFTSATAFAATRIDCEDAEDDGVRPGDREKNEIEGFVTDANVDVGVRSGSFEVSGQAVSFTSGVQFRNGSIEDLIDGARVEVEGAMNGSTLVAREIKFKRVRVILATTVEARTAATITLFGKAVQINALTEIDARASGGNSGSLDDIAVGDFVEMRGFLDGGSLVAERVKEESSGSRDAIVQARVVAENEQAFTLGLLDAGAPIDASLANTSQFEGRGDSPITREQFFAAVAAAPTAGTLVKLKGAWNGSQLLVREAELED